MNYSTAKCQAMLGENLEMAQIALDWLAAAQTFRSPPLFSALPPSLKTGAKIKSNPSNLASAW